MSQAAESKITEGDLSGALVELQDSVRNDPSNPSLRIFLFQLLCVKGDYQRALTQLNVAAELDAEALLMAQSYRELLLCESYRSAVFDGKHMPLIFGEPPAWTVSLLQGLALAANGDGIEAKRISETAFEAAPARSGFIDEEPFEWLADADMRIGPVMEAIINGKYYWVPFDAIAEVTLSAPEDLRDLVWLPAKFEWTNGGEVVAFIPSRYPGDVTVSEDSTALSRKTTWNDLGDEYFIGAGQKVFACDSTDFPLLEVRSIKFSDSGS